MSTTQVTVTSVTSVSTLSNVTLTGRRMLQQQSTSGVHVAINVTGAHPTAAGSQSLARNITTAIVNMTNGGTAPQYQTQLRNNGLTGLTGVTLASRPQASLVGIWSGVLVSVDDILRNASAAVNADLSKLGINATVVEQDSTAIIVGTVVGGGGVGIICLIVLCCVYCRMRRSKHEQAKLVQGVPLSLAPGDPYAPSGPRGARGGGYRDDGGYGGGGGGYGGRQDFAQQRSGVAGMGAGAGMGMGGGDNYMGTSPRARDAARGANPYGPQQPPPGDYGYDPVGRGWDQAYDPNVTRDQRRMQASGAAAGAYDGSPALTKEEAERYIDQRSRVCGQVPVWERLGICSVM